MEYSLFPPYRYSDKNIPAFQRGLKLRFQIETLEKNDKPLRLQNETLKKGRG